MLKITREQFDEYVEYAKKEEELVDNLVKEYSKASGTLPQSISLRKYVVKHLLIRLRIIGRVDTDPVFLDYKDYETLERYKGYIVLDDESKKVNKK